MVQNDAYPAPSTKGAYPQPRTVGGTLIRKVVSLFKEFGWTLPVSRPVWIAVSGGADSVALVHLLSTYGRRVLGVSQLGIVHYNHGWRQGASDEDEAFVRELAVRLKLPIRVQRSSVSLAQLQKQSGSWEEFARNQRKAFFESEFKENSCWFFTAHHAQDLVETMLWRLFSGTSQTHGGGISFCSSFEVRPFLRVSPATIRDYLQEEGLSWREDETNLSTRFLRNQIRQELVPQIQRLFPMSQENLVEMGIQAQLRQLKKSESEDLKGKDIVGRSEVEKMIFEAEGLKLRKSHWHALESTIFANAKWSGELHLSAGWKLQKGNDLSRLSRLLESEKGSMKQQWVLLRKEKSAP